MAKKRVVHPPEKQNTTGAYTSGLLCDGWLFVSGHGSLDLATGKVLHGTVAEETARTLENIGKVLAAAGCSFEDVVKSTCHLARIEDFDEFDAAYAKFFPDQPPARTTVESGLWGGLKVEIDVMARCTQAGSQQGG